MSKFYALIAGLLLSVLASPSVADAGTYGKFNFNHKTGFGHRQYTFFSKKHNSNRHHFAVYHPRQPKFVFFHNPHTNRFWGRYNLETSKYQILAEADQREKLEDVDEKTFGRPGNLPLEEEGGEQMPAPPAPEKVELEQPAKVIVIVVPQTQPTLPKFTIPQQPILPPLPKTPTPTRRW